ncbi:histidine kinase-like ATPase, C-terminal domain-containing protein, partial [Tanacetum coccineum]
SASKDWFEISVKEWQFAGKKGESFSIARVVLSGDKTAQVAIFKNPVKLCRDGELKLAVLMSKTQMGEFVL